MTLTLLATRALIIRKIHTEIEIEAPADRVWQELTDFAAFPDWNPFIESVEGDLSAGARLKVNLKGMSFNPTLLKVEADRELRWLGRLMAPGLFDGEHHFIIENNSEGGVRFIQGESFTGVLVPLMALLGIFRSTARSFDEMNRALKDRAEAQQD